LINFKEKSIVIKFIFIFYQLLAICQKGERFLKIRGFFNFLAGINFRGFKKIDFSRYKFSRF